MGVGAAFMHESSYLAPFDKQIFDAPGLNKTFEERLQAINDWFSAHPTDYAKVLRTHARTHAAQHSTAHNTHT